jgi:ubiquinone/menaquinone biosynthesis C-methylase UbiE
MVDEAERFDAQATYGAAAEVYEEASRLYWSFSAERTVQRLALTPGMRVLDVACGTGTSAIPAAVTVGPSGSVLAVDYAEPMLDIARRKAADLDLGQIEFRVADMTRLDLPAEGFDAVICVLGVFFVEDMARLVSDLWRLVRPGGSLAITTLGPRVFTPVIDEWRSVVSSLRPGRSVSLPWQRTDHPDTVKRLMGEARVDSFEVRLESNRLPLVESGDVWRLVMGTGLRAVTTALGSDMETVRHHLEDWVGRSGVGEVDLDVIYATATKPDR